MTSGRPTSSLGGPYVSKTHAIRVTENLKFGVGGIGFSTARGPTRYRDLLLDIHAPADADASPRPALIMAFGGAFHRGSRQNDLVEEGEHRNTPISDYCREFARRGYVCFSIDYRLMQEDPDPGVTPTLPPGAPLNMDRVNHVRHLLGLPPGTTRMMANEIEAATDDMSAAVAFVRARAHAFGIDVNRIAIGGFSAGAMIALNAALAERAPVAAVVALSGRISAATAEAHLTGAPGEPAILMFIGENDLPVMLDNLDGPAAHMTRVGIAHRIVRVPKATHFYPRTASVPSETDDTTDVETIISEFLYRHLKLAELAGPDASRA